jgi:hypothetical protein
VAALDQGQGRPGGPVGRRLDGLGRLAGPVGQQQLRVPVRGGLHRFGQVAGRGFIRAADGAYAAEKGIGERPLGGLDAGVAGLVKTGFVQHPEQGRMRGREPHVAARHSRQPLARVAELLRGRHELAVAELVGVHRDRRQQFVPVGEVRVGGADRHAEAPARLGQREVPDAALADELDSGINQRGPQVAVVVPAALASPGHDPSAQLPGSTAGMTKDTPVSRSEISHSRCCAAASCERALDSTRTG